MSGGCGIHAAFNNGIVEGNYITDAARAVYTANATVNLVDNCAENISNYGYLISNSGSNAHSKVSGTPSSVESPTMASSLQRVE